MFGSIPRSESGPQTKIFSCFFSGWIRLSKGLYGLTGLGQSPTGLIPMVGTRNGTIQPYPYFVLIKGGVCIVVGN